MLKPNSEPEKNDYDKLPLFSLPPELFAEISVYLSIVDVIMLHSTCTKLYKTDLLEKTFQKHFEIKPPRNETTPKKTAYEMTKQRFDDMFASFSEKQDRNIMRKWLELDEDTFKNDPDSFLMPSIQPPPHGTAFEFFARYGLKVMLQRLLNFVNDQISIDTLFGPHYHMTNFSLLDGRIGNGLDKAFRAAAEKENFVSLQILWDFANELKDPDIVKKLLNNLLIRNFRWAAQNGHVDVLQKIWNWMGEFEGLREIKKSDLKSAFVKTAGDEHERPEVLQTLWNYAGELTNSIELKHQFLISCGEDCLYESEEYEGRQCLAFRHASQNELINVLQKLWDFAGELPDSSKIKFQLLDNESPKPKIFYRRIIPLFDDVTKHHESKILFSFKLELCVGKTISAQASSLLFAKHLEDVFKEIDTLIAKGANINFVSNDKSILDQAIEAKNDKIASYLKSKGAITFAEMHPQESGLSSSSTLFQPVSVQQTEGASAGYQPGNQNHGYN